MHSTPCEVKDWFSRSLFRKAPGPSSQVFFTSVLLSFLSSSWTIAGASFFNSAISGHMVNEKLLLNLFFSIFSWNARQEKLWLDEKWIGGGLPLLLYKKTSLQTGHWTVGQDLFMLGPVKLSSRDLFTLTETFFLSLWASQSLALTGSVVWPSSSNSTSSKTYFQVNLMQFTGDSVDCCHFSVVRTPYDLIFLCKYCKKRKKKKKRERASVDSRDTSQVYNNKLWSFHFKTHKIPEKLRAGWFSCLGEQTLGVAAVRCSHTFTRTSDLKGSFGLTDFIFDDPVLVRLRKFQSRSCLSQTTEQRWGAFLHVRYLSDGVRKEVFDGKKLHKWSLSFHPIKPRGVKRSQSAAWRAPPRRTQAFGDLSGGRQTQIWLIFCLPPEALATWPMMRLPKQHVVQPVRHTSVTRRYRKNFRSDFIVKCSRSIRCFCAALHVYTVS